MTITRLEQLGLRLEQGAAGPRAVLDLGPPSRLENPVTRQPMAQALVPPRSSLEVLVQLTVNGEPYRFAAVRQAGRTFRGLLAGAKGKVWSERFELDDFPGVVRLVAGLLQVPPEAVKAVGPDTPQE